MAQEEKKIYVYENWSSEIPRELGILYVSNVRGTEIFSFEYNEEYLKNPASCCIDPELELFQGRQFTYQKPNFGIFADSAPDRWGRTLMDRRERILAKAQGRKQQSAMLTALCGSPNSRQNTMKPMSDAGRKLFTIWQKSAG
ncbi:HipA N-terminal domain-containing protein [bacterium]|nr:HipA N-terminal domain-containing protein [bacterium]